MILPILVQKPVVEQVVGHAAGDALVFRLPLDADLPTQEVYKVIPVLAAQLVDIERRELPLRQRYDRGTGNEQSAARLDRVIIEISTLVRRIMRTRLLVRRVEDGVSRIVCLFCGNGSELVGWVMPSEAA